VSSSSVRPASGSGREGEADVTVAVRGLRKSYGDHLAADDVSFEARRGEILGLLGPNGAGKTTTLECLEGIRQPDGGTLDVMGVDPTRQPSRLRRLIGVQLQSGGLPADMQVGEAMAFVCAYQGVPPRPDLLERLGLADKLRVTYRGLSTGLSAAWPWRSPSPTAPPSSSWTSPPPASTSPRGSNCTPSCATSPTTAPRSSWPPTTWPRRRRWPTASRSCCAAGSWRPAGRAT
jgi:ABC-type sugar transport system ATPase subunit